MKCLSFFLLFTLHLSSLHSQYITDHPELIPFYSPTGRPRVAAEWEPALGTLIAWPLSLPHKLVIELANDNRLYLLVNDRQSQQDAVNWMMKWGITPDRIKFIAAPQGIDVSWTRDWGPYAVFVQNGEMKLGDARYQYATPAMGLECRDTLDFIYRDSLNNIIQTLTDDRIPEFIGNALNLEQLNLPFAYTGGNVFVDGQRTAISSCALTSENRYTGVTDEKFFRDEHQLLGIENHHIISNFEEHGIQHIDCFMKMLDEDRLLVARPPSDHPAFEQYEGIIKNELSRITNAYGRPFEILRLDTDVYEEDKLAAYTNSLILNKVIYVPLFGIAQDSIALRQWREAMPGYIVKGFEFNISPEPALSKACREHYKRIGWNQGDALHCRTRAIWDPQMLYMSVDKVRQMVSIGEEIKEGFRVIIKDYSRQGLIHEKVIMHWRKTGDTTWREVQMTKDALPDMFVVFAPNEPEFDYYFSAESSSGRKETKPRTAPVAYFK